jgi:hypothetical protein
MISEFWRMNPEFDTPESYWLEPDFLLLDLVSYLANKLGAQIGITLMIKGAFLTGTLVGEREYLEALSRLFQDMITASLPKELSAEERLSITESLNFSALTEDIYPEEMGADEDEEDAFDTPPIRYLHLKDPSLIQAGAALSLSDNPLPIMRIRISAVDGWMTGRLMTMGDSDEDSLGKTDRTGGGTLFTRPGRIQ